MTRKLTQPKPEKPDPSECCGSGCVPCIYDYYYDRLAEWEEKHGVDSATPSTEKSSSQASNQASD